MTTYVPDREPEHMIREEVEEFEHFNGATCLVTVDVTVLGQGMAMDAAQGRRPVPSSEAIGDRLVETIRRKVAECPEVTKVKLQLLYHYGAKPLVSRPGDPGVSWKIQESIKHALEQLKDGVDKRLAKLFLCGCHSDIQDLDLVETAFGIPSVTHVATFREVIWLQPGRVCGATQTAPDSGVYKEGPLTVVVWERGEDGQLRGKQPGSRLDDDECLDLNSITVRPQDAPPVAPCPSTHAMSGNGKVKVAGGLSKTAAGRRVTAMAAARSPFSQGTAHSTALDQMENFSCPNPQCTDKSLDNLRVSETFTIETTILGWIFGSWTVYAHYTWTAEVTCD